MDTEYPRIVRGYYYMPDMHPGLYCIELSGHGTPGDGEVMREPSGKIAFFLLDDARKFVKGEYDIVKKARDTDIFFHLDELNLTERMYVVAPGENGADYYEQLDAECFTIIVNKACDLELPRRDMWMVADPTPFYAKMRGPYDWFSRGLATCEPIACFNSMSLMDFFDRCKYTHEWAPEIFNDFSEPVKNRIRGGLTISGMALQMAYWLGAKEIILCGVDMCGSRYYDGNDRGIVSEKDKVWTRVVPLMNQLIKWIEDHGVKVYSLSPTALEVRTWQHQYIAM